MTRRYSGKRGKRRQLTRPLSASVLPRHIEKCDRICSRSGLTRSQLLRALIDALPADVVVGDPVWDLAIAAVMGEL